MPSSNRADKSWYRQEFLIQDFFHAICKGLFPSQEFILVLTLRTVIRIWPKPLNQARIVPEIQIFKIHNGIESAYLKICSYFYSKHGSELAQLDVVVFPRECLFNSCSLIMSCLLSSAK